YRMLMALMMILAYVLIRKFPLRVPLRTLLLLLVAGAVVAAHWVTFFMAIKVSNVSIALATMSTGAFFAALLEPFCYGRKIIWYEIVFGIVVMLGLYLIFKVETDYIYGIGLALISAFLSAVFSMLNGKLTQYDRPSLIYLYEFVS